MLIDAKTIINILKLNKITTTGIFHIGAHDCEEYNFYNEELCVKPCDMLWIEAVPYKVKEAASRGINNVYNAIITDKNDIDTTINITNNVASSSILELGTHSEEHPWIVCVGKLIQKSITIDTFFERNKIDPSIYSFWNIDIQGAELLALKGGTNSIKYAIALYLEVNEKELYKKCSLIDDIDNFLLAYNFKRVMTQMTIHGWGDALYIRKD